jgi:hypothetical protein
LFCRDNDSRDVFARPAAHWRFVLSKDDNLVDLKEKCTMWRGLSAWMAPVFVVAFIAFQAAESQAQQPVTLPAGWQQMSPTDFAAAVRPLFDQDTFKSLSEEDQNAAKIHGLQLFLQIDVSNTSLNYQTLEVLHHLARYLLEPSQIQKTKTALLARQDNWAGQPYAEIRAKVVMMMRLDIPEAAIVQEARKWVQGGGTFQQVPQSDLKYDIVREAFADVKVIDKSFSVQWSGQINAPQTGDYTFFVSPININAATEDRAFKFTMSVIVAGQNLLNSTPAEQGTQQFSGYPKVPVNLAPWVSQSQSVTLTAGTPVALLVTLTVNAPQRLPVGALHAMLYWQGPGVTKSLVPASSLTLPNGSGPGLQATYSWTSGGQAQTLTRTDPMIDFAWANSTILLSQNTSIASQASDLMWQSATSPDFLNTLTGPPVKLHPFIKDEEDASTGLSTARRQAFLDILLQNPSLLSPLEVKRAVGFYRSFRLGTPDKALDVFGAWATQSADLPTEISTDRVLDGDNRFWLAQMATMTTQQLPEAITRLQNQFLQLPDGRCSLPVAYTLTYSNLGKRTLSKWIAFLDAKLADTTLTGDQRVNWLIARAHAQGHTRHLFTQKYPYRFPIPPSWPQDGFPYLYQAIRAAQSPAVKIRATREVVALLVWLAQFQKASDLLQQLGKALPNDQKAGLVALQQQVAGFAAANAQYLQNRQSTANRAFVAQLKARRDRAASRGDTALMNHYNSLLSAAQNKQ